MVYEFELGCNAEEATKNIGYVKGESTIDHRVYALTNTFIDQDKGEEPAVF